MTKKTKDPQITFGYKHLVPGHPDNPKPYNICGARTRSIDAKGPYCRRKAGWGTSHVNVGRCAYHGGKTEMGPLATNWKGGRYAHIWRGRLAQHFEQIRQDDTNPLDLLPELEVSRVVLSMALDRMLATPTQVGQQDNRTNFGNVENVGTTLDGEAMNATGGPPPLNMNGYHLDIASSEFFPNPTSDFRLVSADDINLVRECTADVINAATKMIAARNQTALTKAETMYILMIMKEAITRFVPKESREAFVRYLMERVPDLNPEKAIDGPDH